MDMVSLLSRAPLSCKFRKPDYGWHICRRQQELHMTRTITTGLKAAFLGATACILAAVAGTALADPQGTYAVSGTNPSDGAAYQGTVTVTKTGDTYQLDWDVNGTQFVGIGLGAERMPDNSLTVGPASPNDAVLLVGYVSDGGFGQGFFVELPDGSWKGIWAYGGGEQIGTEVWTRQ
jgi:hypothetical protein